MRRNHLLLHFPLSHLQNTKHFIDDFLHEQLPLEHEQVAIIGLMLSVKASSCQFGTNEPPGKSFQTHSIGSGMLLSISELPKVTSLDTCSFYMLKNSRWRWNYHLKVYIRRRNKMIYPPCFEGCLFRQAICFVDKVTQRIKFIHFDVYWTVTKFLKNIGKCSVSRS